MVLRCFQVQGLSLERRLCTHVGHCMYMAMTVAWCALQVSQPLGDASVSQDEDLVEFERECIARAVTGEAEPEPSVYFLGESTCTAAGSGDMACFCSVGSFGCLVSQIGK